MIKEIKHQGQILALIIKNFNKNKKGIKFFTPNNLSQQVAYMYHKKKHVIQPHLHKKRLKKIYDTNEVLIILDGKMKVDFFTTKKKYLKSEVLNKNNIIILMKGGHGFKIMKDCKFIEVKQGPYLADKDKERFNYK